MKFYRIKEVILPTGRRLYNVQKLRWSGWLNVAGMGYAGSGQFYNLEDVKERVRHLKSIKVKYHYSGW